MKHEINGLTGIALLTLLALLAIPPVWAQQKLPDAELREQSEKN